MKWYTESLHGAPCLRLDRGVVRWLCATTAVLMLLEPSPQRATTTVLLLQRPLPASSASVSLFYIPKTSWLLPRQIQGFYRSLEKTLSTLPSSYLQRRRVPFATICVPPPQPPPLSLSPPPPQPRLLHFIRSYRLLKGSPRSWITCPENRIGDFHT